MEKLNDFISKRKYNWKKINKYICSRDNFFITHQATENSDPSWFGYAITLRDNLAFKRDDLIKYLNENRIDTRLMFGGNLIKQPAYKNKKYLVNNSLINADKVMNDTFWIGVYPGITDEMIQYVEEKFDEFLSNY